MSKRHASSYRHRTITGLGIFVLLLLLATPSLAKSSKNRTKGHAKGTMPSACSIAIAPTQIELLDGAGEGFTDLVEVYHTVNGAETAPSLVTLTDGNSDAQSVDSQAKGVATLAANQAASSEICTQVTLIGAATDGSDLVGFGCTSAPIQCGEKSTSFTNEIILCMDHQIGVDGSCTQIVATLRTTYQGSRLPNQLASAIAKPDENNAVDPHDPCPDGELVRIDVETEEMACPYYDPENPGEPPVMGSKTQKTTVFICGYVTGPCHQGCHGWVEKARRMVGDWSDCEPTESDSSTPSDETEDGSGGTGGGIADGSGPL